MNAVRHVAVRFPHPEAWLRRLIYIVGGVSVFLWLRVEDNAVWPAALGGWGISIWLTADWTLRRFGGRRLPPGWWCILLSLAGTASGAGAALATAVLMLLKNGLHGHIVPDFPFSLIADMLTRLPAWAGTGLLIGLGLAFAALAFQPRPSSD